FAVSLAHFGWSDDQGGPHSMDNPRAWRASWPLQGPDLPPLRAGLVAALERAALRLQEHGRAPHPIKPRWDRHQRELWYGKVLCTRFERTPPHQGLILESFEELSWPSRIDDPLPRGKLADTVKDLRRRLRGTPLEFACDGRGRGVIWTVRPGYPSPEIPSAPPTSPLTGGTTEA